MLQHLDSRWLTSTNQECAAACIGHVDREGEPDDWRGDGFIHEPFTLRFVKHVVENEQRLVVASVDDWAD